MKKLLIVISLFLLTSVAQAGVNVGISGMRMAIDVEGSETLKSNGLYSTKNHAETAEAAEAFIELSGDSGMFFGVAIIPGEAELGSSSSTRTDKLTSGSSTVTQKAAAEFSDHTTFYIGFPIGDGGMYAKIGGGTVDVTTQESLGTGSSYGDQTVNFGLAGLGYEMDLGAMFARIEGTYSNYEEVELKSTGSDVSSTIRGDIDALTGRISLGMAF